MYALLGSMGMLPLAGSPWDAFCVSLSSMVAVLRSIVVAVCERMSNTGCPVFAVRDLVASNTQSGKQRRVSSAVRR